MVELDSPARHDFQIQLATTLDELDELEDDWKDLYARSDASPFCSFEWIRNDVAHGVRPAGLSFCVSVVRHGGEAVAIVPLAVLRQRFATSMSFLASGQAPRGTIMVAPEIAQEDVLLEICEHARGSFSRWDYCVFNKISPGSPPYAELDRARTAGRLEAKRVGTNVRIDLPASWEDYARGLSRSHRKNVTRRIRGLAKLGEPRLVRVGMDTGVDPAEIDKTFDDALRVCGKSWQGLGERGRPICHPHMESFYRHVSLDSARNGRLDLSVLYVGERPVSFIWGLSRHPVTNIVTLGFDPEFKDSSPGLAHMGLLVQDSIERGFDRIDFGHEFSEYKRKWSKSGDEVFEFTCYAHPRWSRLRRRAQGKWNGSVVRPLRGLLGR